MTRPNDTCHFKKKLNFVSTKKNPTCIFF
ncbi:hypothetical protein [African swine fever virus]|uniref:ASFV G ACD 00240 CDS n=1 Tax=African swine fever virus TaxID=10497 RepID=A0A7R8V7B9_ASF|nr:ASFV G ACD 00240 CDS [African swine fever virus]